MEDKNESLREKYQFILEKLQEIGDRYNEWGHFQDKDMPFYGENGCEVTNYIYDI